MGRVSQKEMHKYEKESREKVKFSIIGYFVEARYIFPQYSFCISNQFTVLIHMKAGVNDFVPKTCPDAIILEGTCNFFCHDSPHRHSTF